MPVNVEIKARLPNPDPVRPAARKLSNREEIIRQEDTFFRVSSGRLKLRRFFGSRAGSGELIYYRRSDETGPRPSDYRIWKTDDPEELLSILSDALGVIGTVRKTRHLFLSGRTRIHLDEVEGLGTYLELEVVLGPGDAPAVAEKEAIGLMDKLGIRGEDLISKAYMDLLLEKSGAGEARAFVP